MSNILDVIGDIDDGAAVIRFTDAVSQAVKAAQATRKKAKVTFSLAIEPTGDKTVSIKAEIKTQIPQPSLNVATFFPGRDGLLYRFDPSQQVMRFNTDTGEVSEPSREDPDA